MKLGHDPKLPEYNSSPKDMTGQLQGRNLLPGEFFLGHSVCSWEWDSVILMSLFQLIIFYVSMISKALYTKLDIEEK